MLHVPSVHPKVTLFSNRILKGSRKVSLCVCVCGGGGSSGSDKVLPFQNPYPWKIDWTPCPPPPPPPPPPHPTLDPRIWKIRYLCVAFMTNFPAGNLCYWEVSSSLIFVRRIWCCRPICKGRLAIIKMLACVKRPRDIE